MARDDYLSRKERHRSRRSRDSRSRSRSVSREREHRRNRSRDRDRKKRHRKRSHSYDRDSRSRRRRRSYSRSRSRSRSRERKRRKSHRSDRDRERRHTSDSRRDRRSSRDAGRHSPGDSSDSEPRREKRTEQRAEKSQENQENLQQSVAVPVQSNRVDELNANKVIDSDIPTQSQVPVAVNLEPASKEDGTKLAGEDMIKSAEHSSAGNEKLTVQGDSNGLLQKEEPAETKPSLTTESKQAPGNSKAGENAAKPAVEPGQPPVSASTKLALADMQAAPPAKLVPNSILPGVKATITKMKKKKPKKVAGFFGGEDDEEDDDQALKDAKRKKNFISLSEDEDRPLQTNTTDPDQITAMEVSKPSEEAAAGDDDGEEDELDAFMTNITTEVEAINTAAEATVSTTEPQDTGRILSDEEDAEGGIKRVGSDEEEDFVVEEEEEEESWLTKMRKKRPTYEKVNHDEIEYTSFKKQFYIESAELSRMTPEEVQAYRRELGGIKIRGQKCPRPVKTWGQCGLPSKVLEMIRKQNYERPTPIQSQAIPCIMSGRNVIGVAKTGSGKTLSFVLPMMRHIAAQPGVVSGEGPVGLIVAPTRELAIQIFVEAKKFCKGMGFKIVCAYGGSGVGEQISELKRGAEIVVCTPGRMIDLLGMNQGRITNLRRVTFVVLDEADRMFDMGFEPQISRIVENVRPDRQTVMFSATFPSQVEMLARKILKSPVEIVVGGNSVASATIDQHVEVLEEDAKFVRLLDVIGAWKDKGAILVFVERQETADRIFRDLLRAGNRCLALHGGMDQADRDSAIVDFKNGDIDLLVATSVAARGLDVKRLRVVVNFDVPNHYEDYVHRVGRTGRAGNKGTSYTFITKEQDMHAPDLVKALEMSAKRIAEDSNPNRKKEELNLEEVAKAAVPAELRTLAEGFANKMKLGLVKHGASSGYGGKGFKFNEEEESAKVALKKMQAEEYGVVVKSSETKEEEEDEPIIKDISSREDATRPATKAAVVPKPGEGGIPSAGAGSQPGGAGAQPAGANVGKAADQLSAEDLKARHLASVLSKSVKPKAKTAAMPTATAAASATAAAGISAADKSAEAAAAAAAVDEINKRFGKVAAPVQEEPEPAQVMRKYTELEINDYPQHARWKVTHKNSLAYIEEFTNCAVTTKGHFFPPGRNPAAGERKLYLLIEGPDESSVKLARTEVKQRLEEYAMSRPDEKPQYGKYTIV